jgi:hypothetical protein
LRQLHILLIILLWLAGAVVDIAQAAVVVQVVY